MTLAQLFIILVMVESSGNDLAVSTDGVHLGCLQIGELYLADANRFGGTDFSMNDMFDREKSKQVFYAYMRGYATEERLGRPVLIEDAARMHYGGPNGWRYDSTLPYWEHVKRVIRASNQKLASH